MLDHAKFPHRRPLCTVLVVLLATTGAAPTAAAAPGPAAPDVASTAPVADVSTAAPAPAPAVDPAAQTAHTEAVRAVSRGEFDEAVARLDRATEIAPTWVPPVRLRAEVFALLIERHPTDAFMAARAADLQRLLILEPGVDTAAREAELAALQRRARTSEQQAQRRRKMSTPALIISVSSAALLIGGAMLVGMRPDEFWRPTAYRQERRDIAGDVLLIAGAALVPPGVVLGVLAAKQVRHDSAVRRFEIAAGRPPRAAVRLAPRVIGLGGGAGLDVRF